MSKFWLFILLAIIVCGYCLPTESKSKSKHTPIIYDIGRPPCSEFSYTNQTLSIINCTFVVAANEDVVFDYVFIVNGTLIVNGNFTVNKFFINDGLVIVNNKLVFNISDENVISGRMILTNATVCTNRNLLLTINNIIWINGSSQITSLKQSGGLLQFNVNATLNMTNYYLDNADISIWSDTNYIVAKYVDFKLLNIDIKFYRRISPVADEIGKRVVTLINTLKTEYFTLNHLTVSKYYLASVYKSNNDIMLKISDFYEKPHYGPLFRCCDAIQIVLIVAFSLLCIVVITIAIVRYRRYRNDSNLSILIL